MSRTDETEAAALFESKETDKPALGAGELIVIVPVEANPPTTEVGLRTNVLTVGPVTPSVAVADDEFAVAVIVAEELVATATVVTVKVPDVVASWDRSCCGNRGCG